jgi:hypothetical protein
MAIEVLRAYWRRLHGLEAAPEPVRIGVTKETGQPE